MECVRSGLEGALSLLPAGTVALVVVDSTARSECFCAFRLQTRLLESAGGEGAATDVFATSWNMVDAYLH